MFYPEDIKEVFRVIALHEDDVFIECTNYVIDEETGLDPSTVDEVLDYLWKADLIEGVAAVGVDRKPSLIGIRRVLSGRKRRFRS